MQLELLLNNERRTLPSVRAFVEETLRQIPLESMCADRLSGIVLAAVGNAIDRAYPEGEAGSIRLTVREELGKLVVVVRDYGLPENVERLEQQVHEPSASGLNLFGCPATDVVDQVDWLAYGPEGKALQLMKWLHLTQNEYR
jgi:anti-sigma regulatory factor (Ser/Thr protein kinase)